MKYSFDVSLERLRHEFKFTPRMLSWKLATCTYNVYIVRYYCNHPPLYEMVEVNSLDDVVQCILKYA